MLRATLAQHGPDARDVGELDKVGHANGHSLRECKKYINSHPKRDYRAIFYTKSAYHHHPRTAGALLFMMIIIVGA